MDPKGIRTIGIGFGRCNDGQSKGTPDKNPLLQVHITAIMRPKISDSSKYRPGHIINKQGIDLGLTDTNTESMKFTALIPGIAGEHFITGISSSNKNPRSIEPDKVWAVYSPCGLRPTFINTSRYIFGLDFLGLTKVSPRSRLSFQVHEPSIRREKVLMVSG
jgi:hypothetical protein